MHKAVTAPRADQWGTAEWFARQFSSGNADDPTAYFSHAVNGYQVFRHQALSRWLCASLDGVRPGSLLDVGCGTGVLTALLAEDLSVDRAVGIDFVADAVRDAQGRYPRLEFVTAALPKLNYPEASFDLVVASEVLYYLAAEDREATVREIVRVLRPGGRLFFTTRLGDRYFELASALELLGSDLQVEQQGFIHNRVFENLTRPLRGTRVLAELASSGASGVRSEYRRFAERAGWLLDNPMSRFALASAARFDRQVTSSSRLPAICHHVGRVVCPTFSRSNVLLLARKK